MFICRDTYRIPSHRGLKLWIARAQAFDLPFGLPREPVQALGWPLQWLPLMQHYSSLSRADVHDAFAAFCAARPAGSKFARRACDGPAGSSPSMKWVNPPVAYVLHAGVPLLIRSGVDLPGLHPGDAMRVALEGYPGLLTREVLGIRSYKSDTRAKQTSERLIARKDLIDALEQGLTRLQLRLRLSRAQRHGLVADASGDHLDAVLCMLQSAWAARQPVTECRPVSTRWKAGSPARCRWACPMAGLTRCQATGQTPWLAARC